MERCWKSGLPNVIGNASSAVGAAELGSGQKSENRMPSASAADPERITPHEKASAVRTGRCPLLIDFMVIGWNLVCCFFLNGLFFYCGSISNVRLNFKQHRDGERAVTFEC